MVHIFFFFTLNGVVHFFLVIMSSKYDFQLFVIHILYNLPHTRIYRMKKLIAIAAISLLPFTNAMADQDIGCGLGSMIFAGEQGKVMKVLGATTNGTSGNQTFGITFGTLGCDGTGTITSTAKLALFIDGNMDNLARDIAKGEGETLATLTEAWGVAEQDKAVFAELAQANFSEIFTSENVTSQNVLENLNKVIANNDQLSVYTLS
jgi:hypothetical protein